ncbi:NADP-dependent phosphogluconate dehydrogenase [soil metagenome]
MSDGDSSRHVGVIGLAVMGENLALNIERNGFPIAVYNRSWERTEAFMQNRAAGLNVVAGKTPAELVSLLERPRRIIIMVKAGAPVDAVINELVPLLEEGDMIIDGGNSFFPDTERRSKEVASHNLNFIGMGISGGEEGALWGPSIMPGGPAAAYEILEPMLTAISAKSDSGPCVTHIGPGGAGHYVKMVHNGIEYGDMQLIAETYDVMRRALKLPANEIAEIFAKWNQGPLASYLIEITAEVLAYNDPATGQPLVDLILDTAEQKGTGRWTSQNALELASPIPTIDAAVFARTMSSMKDKRVAASAVLHGPSDDTINGVTDGLDRDGVLADLEAGLLFAKISSYAQGMALLRAASENYSWNLNLAEIARIWKAGCIIRALLFDPIRQAFSDNPQLPNLLLADNFVDNVNAGAGACRSVVSLARAIGIPVPAHSASLDYFDSYRTANLPANLTQGQRDYFGAHTYRRTDRDGVFHTEWSAVTASN